MLLPGSLPVTRSLLRGLSELRCSWCSLICCTATASVKSRLLCTQEHEARDDTPTRCLQPRSRAPLATWLVQMNGPHHRGLAQPSPAQPLHMYLPTDLLCSSSTPPPSCADAEFCGCVGRCARQTPLQGGESGTCRIDTLNLSITPRKFQFCYGFMTLYLVTVCSSNYCKTPFSSSAFASDQPNFQTNLSHVILSYETPMMPKLYIFSNKFTTCVLIHFVCVYVWSSVFFL